MLNLKPAVKHALESVDGVKQVTLSFPDDFAVVPAISYYEINNSPRSCADDAEYLSEVNFAVDIWANTSAQTSTIADAVNAAMTGIGFTREMSHDVPDQSDIRHKAMRFSYIGG